MEVSHIWVVRGGDNNELASQVRSKHAVAIGWASAGDVSAAKTREEMRQQLESAQPGSGTPNAVGQMFRFVNEIIVGDYILTPERATKTVHISRCAGVYRFDPSVFGDSYPQVRPVEYLKTVPRRIFSQTVRNTLGSVLTVFRADIALPYIDSQLGLAPQISQPESDDAELGLWADEIEGQSRGQILEALDNIEHHDFQLFVAGLLNALEYKTVVGKKGKDGGVDVLAYPDAFGLATPRIKVQVKNQKGPSGIQDVGYLHGVLGTGESGLFVCTGGFSKDALDAPFVRAGRVALIDGNAILDLIIEHYHAMPTSATRLLPLRRLYIPERPAN